MGARHKLNQSFVNRALFWSATLGLATRSMIVFLVTLIAIVASGMHAGDIRPHSRRRGRRR